MRLGPLSGRALLLIAALGTAGLLGHLALERAADDAAVLDEDDLLPPGRWHLRSDLGRRPSSEELARLLSLPYQAGSRPPPGLFGVTHHDPARTQPGANLYVSGHGPEVVLMDAVGEPLHRWRYRFEDAFPDKPPSVETAFFRRAHLLPGGALLAIYQGGGLVRLDVASNLEWRVDAGFYNDLFVAGDGTIHGLTKSVRSIPEIHPTEPVLEDALVTLDRNGAELHRLSLLDCFRGSPYAELLQPLPSGPDIFHSNTVEVFDGSLAADSALFAAGNVLVSLREVDIVAIVDPARRTVVWAQRGPWRAQHEPALLANGSILLFDNQGAKGRSRVLEVDPTSGRILWQYRGDGERPLFSREAGAVQRLANGNTLITESERGRAFEITREGETVWEFYSPHRAGAGSEYVATLFDVTRVEPELARFPR